MNHFDKIQDRLVWRGNGEVLSVQPWGADSLRVRSSRSDVFDTDHALLDQEPCPDAVIDIQGCEARVTNGAITASLHAEHRYDHQLGHDIFTCTIEYTDRDGRVLLREVPANGPLKLEARGFRSILGGDHHVTARFESQPDEKLYGMGLYQQEQLDLKGSTLELAHRNSQASVPFVMSNLGYGFLWHNPAIGRATFGKNRTEWVAESTAQLDYWITAADRPADIAAAYARATGHAPMMPEYGLGYWQCKMRYWNQEQLLETAREHKRRDLPLDVIVIDFFHWPKMGDLRFEEEFWPDPKAMLDELRELDIEVMVSVWPQVSLESENFARFRSQNHLVRAERGTDVQMSFRGPSMFLDVTNPDAREAVWELCRQNYYDLGVRVFWLDEAEPEYGVYDFDNYRYHLGPTLQIGNIYPQHFSRTFYEGMVAAGQHEVVNLVRSAWAGSQRYGALVWSGDIESSFRDLRRQVVAGIQMGVAGIPWFTTDIGGFHGGDVRTDEFRELLVRWFQYGTFCPVMRMHGDRIPGQDVTASDGTPRQPEGAANEVWSFGTPVYEILERHLHFRESMRDYTRSVMAEAHTAGQPVMRGMFHEFPDDPAAWDLADQYMFGPSLLVAPVLEAGARSRSVYLPAGRWKDIRTGESLDGPRTVDAPAPLGSTPVFARDGAVEHLVGLL